MLHSKVITSSVIIVTRSTQKVVRSTLTESLTVKTVSTEMFTHVTTVVHQYGTEATTTVRTVMEDSYTIMGISHDPTSSVEIPASVSSWASS